MSKMNNPKINNASPSFNTEAINNVEAQVARALGQLDPTIAEITLLKADGVSTSEIRKMLKLSPDQNVELLHTQGLRALYSRNSKPKTTSVA